MKDQNFLSILNAVLRLEVTKGHLKWKMSDVSRASGVQRTLIYYYFGKSKQQILDTAIKFIGDDFFGLSEERIDMWKSGKAWESVAISRELHTRAPHVAEFYFHWRHSSSPIAENLEGFEKRYLALLKKRYPALKPPQLKAILAVFFGLILTPGVDQETMQELFSRLPQPQ